MDENVTFMDENVTFLSYGWKGHFMDETAKVMEIKKYQPTWSMCHHAYNC